MQQHAKGEVGREVPVDLLCEVRGKVADETFIKKHFRGIAIPGEDEVFWPKAEITDYVRWLRDQWFVAVAETSDAERENLPVVDATTWLPNSTRTKPRPQHLLPGMSGAFDMGQREITGDDFYTNEIIIDAARTLMGGIDLDPASHAIANRVVRATRFFTVSDDGLLQRWSGRVWLNPPFSHWDEWVVKVLSEWRAGGIQEMCVLSAMRTLTARYFAPLLGECDGVCIIHGRIKFWGGVAGDSPDDGHAIFYFGSRRAEFRESFSQLGTVFNSSRES
jgi:ParB family chromosome partitioning protein